MVTRTVTHEAFIGHVADLAIAHYAASQDASDEARQRLARIKLVYGAGATGLRGVTYYDRWRPATNEVRPFVEVCAFGQESIVQLAGTTIHELGHVLAGWNAGHSTQWKEACKALGLHCVKAAGTRYLWSMFAPALRHAIAALPKPDDGEPIPQLSGVAGMLGVTVKPCPAGFGTHGGRSRGKGSGSRLRLWQCSCEPPIKVRVASDRFRAHCDDCTQAFRCDHA